MLKYSMYDFSWNLMLFISLWRLMKWTENTKKDTPKTGYLN